MSNIRLGFSTGCLFESAGTIEAIGILRASGCRMIELGPRIVDHVGGQERAQVTADDLAGFDYVSVHAPKFEYGKPGTAEILNKIGYLNQLRPLDLVVFHPDPVFDFNALEASGLRVGIENMDNRKKSFRTVEELKLVLDRFPKFRLVLDVNHIFTNDPTMKSAPAFFEILGDRIAEYHLSGYKILHDPLFETKQVEILRAIKNKDLPIIVESLLTPATIALERDYILANL